MWCEQNLSAAGHSRAGSVKVSQEDVQPEVRRKFRISGNEHSNFMACYLHSSALPQRSVVALTDTTAAVGDKFHYSDPLLHRLHCRERTAVLNVTFAWNGAVVPRRCSDLKTADITSGRPPCTGSCRFSPCLGRTTTAPRRRVTSAPSLYEFSGSRLKTYFQPFLSRLSVAPAKWLSIPDTFITHSHGSARVF